MKKSDIDKIEYLIKTRKEAHSFYLKKSDVYKSFLSMEQNTYRNGKLSKMDKELIAVGISVAINCESCMEWHIKQALNDGASEEMILEAIEVGIEMAGGPGTVSARFARQVLEYYRLPENGEKIRNH
jgi:AhpD family alkylhydroperoxidase